MPFLPRIARADLHFWEEPCISGTNGSGAVFFSGCSLGCVYCQNYDISHGGFGKTVSYERLAEIFSELERKGAHNINLVNPSHYVGAIEKALSIYKPNIPIVYNSSGYDRECIALKDYIDIYLFDLKYVNCECSQKYSAAGDYFSVASKVIKSAHDRIGRPLYDENGIMQKGVVIRHLLLPSATKEAISVIDWAAENCENAVFSLMSQYTPCGNLEHFPELMRRITKREYEKVTDYLLSKKFFDCYLQERESSDSDYIPDFDLYGV